MVSNSIIAVAYDTQHNFIRFLLNFIRFYEKVQHIFYYRDEHNTGLTHTIPYLILI